MHTKSAAAPMSSRSSPMKALLRLAGALLIEADTE
jgi:hypothetical protein